MAPALSAKGVAWTPLGQEWTAQPTLLVCAQTTCRNRISPQRSAGMVSVHPLVRWTMQRRWCSRPWCSHLLVVAADVAAGVAAVVVVASLLHPALNGLRSLEGRCWVACPYVFTHRGESGGHASRAFRIRVVFHLTPSGPLQSAQGQILVPCLRKQRERGVRS